MDRTFYMVLGVSTDESSDGIRRAYRELAFRYHPDRAGGGGAARFREVAEAYEVLSDPARRASYDEGLRHAGARVAVRVYPTPWTHDVAIEPLVPRRDPFDELFELLWRRLGMMSPPRR